MTKLRTLALPLLALMALTACETAEGLGRDMQNAGAAIEADAAASQ